MESLVECIRSAVTNDATEEARAMGARACRTILAALEAKPGEPIASPKAALDPERIADVVGALRDVAPEQLLDLVIARLRAALPAEVAVRASAPLQFQMISLPPTLGRPR